MFSVERLVLKIPAGAFGRGNQFEKLKTFTPIFKTGAGNQPQVKINTYDKDQFVFVIFDFSDKLHV